MENKFTPDQRLIFLGKVWGIAAQISGNFAFVRRMTKEELVKCLTGDEGESILERIHALNEGYGDILECFNEIIPVIGEGDD